MIQIGLFDYYKRIARIDTAGAPLVALDTMVNWKQFRILIEQAREKSRKSPAGAKGCETILLLKILILQSLYNLSDEAIEYQILYRYSFSRFLGIHEVGKFQETTTIFRFRKVLAQANAVELLITQFDQFLRDRGFRAQKGQIVNASIVRVPIQQGATYSLT